MENQYKKTFPQTPKTEQAAASATPSTESGSNDDAGQH